MSTITQSDFSERFGQLLLQSWTNEEYLGKLINEPGEALEEVGLGLPASVDVRVERREALAPGETPAPYTDEDFQAFYDKWAGAPETGSYVLTIPETAELVMGDMSDSELETISGGSVIIACYVKG